MARHNAPQVRANLRAGNTAWGAGCALPVGKQPWAEVELPAAGALWAAVLHSAAGSILTDAKVDMSRKHHTWKEQAPWLAALVSAVGAGVPAKGFPVAAAGHSAGWNPPRCGVPDLPVLPDGHSGRNRQKRFVLSGGRWDKTNLTYK
ncbi:hypothetical protein DV515_00011447 [Chloebia gouldiae]|uniref:Uncharacterized protein n=1 Tax=Chloebia gouldiae TaxID=44316 RepID=A0A3L8S6D6_CHLGU|nr:hypothetical protein DV515_00011447 [Chloebia gouldiae]